MLTGSFNLHHPVDGSFSKECSVQPQLNLDSSLSRILMRCIWFQCTLSVKNGDVSVKFVYKSSRDLGVKMSDFCPKLMDHNQLKNEMIRTKFFSRSIKNGTNFFEGNKIQNRNRPKRDNIRV